jgi:quinolinate synthase
MSALLEPTPAPLHELKPYKSLSNDELSARIEAVRREFGPRLMILGHHYQQDEVISHSDLRGDSYQLSQMAASSRDCRVIVFCGVHFMAETADIVANRPEKLTERSGERVTVILPDMAAGCSMADMAAIDQVEAAWQDLGEVIDTNDITPVTYINSAASLKAFCGRHSGTRLHFQQRPRRPRLVIQAHQASVLLSRSTSWSQHGPQNGHHQRPDARFRSLQQ